jgi:hypothetical protein
MATETDTTSTAPYEGMLFERISWASIIAGVVIAVVTHLALSLLGLGIGASTIDPLSETNPMSGLGAGAGIWLAGTTLLSLFAGGWVAGKLAGPTRHRDGALHGLVTWGLATILSALVIGSAMSALVGRTASAVSNAVSNVGEAVAPGVASELQASGLGAEEIRREAMQLLFGSGAAGADADPNLASIMARMFTQPGEGLSATERSALVEAVAARTGQSTAQAESTVAGWESRIAESGPAVAQQARETGDVVARRTSQVALWTFFSMVLGALAAVVGGMAGTPSHHAVARPRSRDEYAPRGT